ncbi:MAG: energy-coupled thiamine transporter ThiT [Clostridiales bacterium]|nr:energy-coupled thiamine transporter ThiT [Clostridiales bacterium]MDD7347993.1 energy-coupled thiamine transporter ThiT [Clostridiales bacterium]MDY4060554.1 energy-coupled thiamine transporter ThiT [Anaerovoracaceae bacterium]
MDKKLITLVESGLMIALATILSYIKIFDMPQGGSITAVSMLPIILYATRWGVRNGLLAAMVYGVLQFLLQGGFSISPWSFLLDYLISFGALGLAGFFHGNRNKAVIGAIVGIASRFVVLVISGVLLWAAYAPKGMNPLWYSITYNGTYMLPELVITSIVLYLIYPQFDKIIKHN